MKIASQQTCDSEKPAVVFSPVPGEVSMAENKMPFFPMVVLIQQEKEKCCPLLD